MRVVVLALTLAFVAGDLQHEDPICEAGKTYVYKYEALLLGGLLEKGSARAGLNIRSKVIINAIDQNTYFIKLEEPELQECSGIWPQDPCIPATELTSALRAELTTPIKFEYVRGIVGKIFAPETVSTTVLNIYRGILNAFQLNIKKTLNIYELQEAGTQGVCKTLYSITEDTEAQRVYLRKTRDMNHCQERITKDVGLAYTEKCEKCQQDTRNLRRVSSYNYIMKPLDNGIQINEVVVHELIQFSPFSEMHGAADMETKQSLVLLEVRKTPFAPTTPPSKARYSHRGNLTYEFSAELLQLPIQLLNINNVESQLEETLNQLAKQAVERAHEDAPLKYLKFIQLLRAASSGTLENLWSKHSATSAHRKWILEAIPAIGTPYALRFIKEKYLAERITVFEAVQALITSFHMVTANTETFEVAESLMKESKILGNPVLRRIVFLGYGTMVYRHCYEIASCSAELIKPIQDLLAQALKDENTKDIILLVKALGNAAHPSSLKTITKILPLHSKLGASLPVRVHAEAMMALNNIAKKEPKMVQHLAFQLYGDKTLHPEIRMLACIVLFETRPSMSLMSAVVHIVKKDRNLQVASFTYSHLKSLTRSVVDTSVAAACKVALRMLGPNLDKPGSRFSKAIHVDAYNSPFMLGAAASAYYINDAATIMPKSIAAKTKAFFAGAAADILEVGVRTEGLQEAFLKNPTVFDSTDRIARMKHVIRTLSQWKAASNSKIQTSIYVKFFGQEVAFADFDKERFDGIFEAIIARNNVDVFSRDIFKALLSGPSFHFVKPLLATEVRRIMPTVAGFPMELGLYTAAVAVVAGQIKVTTTPPLPEGFHLRHLLKMDIQISTKVTPSVAVNTFAVIGVNTAILQAALVSRAKLYSTMPANTEATFNINEGYLNVSALPVSVPENITAVDIETFAVVRDSASGEKITPIIPAIPKEILISNITSSNSASESRSSEIISQHQEVGTHKSKVVKSKKKYCAQVVNAGLKACFKIDTAYVGDAAVYKLAGRHSAAFSVKPIEGEAAERLELEFQLGRKAEQKIIKHIDLREEETPEETTVLVKLHKILAPTQKNSTISSSSSSSSSSSRLHVRSSSSSSSSSSHSRSKATDAAPQQILLPKKHYRSSSSNSNRSRSSRSSSSKSRSSSSSSSSRSRSSSSSRSRSSSSSRSRSSSNRSRSSSSSSTSRSNSSTSERRSSSISNKFSFSTSVSTSKSSLASSFASLFSLSSGSSHYSMRPKKESKEKHKKKHEKPHHTSKAARSEGFRSRNSGSSLDAIQQKKRFLGNEGIIFGMIFRAVKDDKKKQGYQATAYLDKTTNRLQIILADIAPDNNWRLCADGAALSMHKVKAKINWGAECNQYDTAITTETGLVGPNPAARLKVDWNRLPSDLKHNAKIIYKRISAYMSTDLIQEKDKNSDKQLSFTVVATSDRILDLIWKTPRSTVSKRALRLPITLPLNEIKLLTSFSDVSGKVKYLFTAAGAAECSFTSKTLTTFNNKKLKSEMPSYCYQVLAQDATDELKFIVLLKKDHTDQNQISVKVGHIDIDLYLKNTNVIVTVNGIEIPTSNLPYHYPRAEILIKQTGEGISVYAASYGLHEVYFDKMSWRIKVVDWMRGKTCGLCGKADGETRQEYHTPTGRIASTAVSFAHSWILLAENCRDTTECRMRHESVQLERQVNTQAQESKCYSVEPVLRCLPGCFPVHTTNVTVGFHCLPADSIPSGPDTMSNMYVKSVDLMETTEGHLACSCTTQCA
ncbi:vitellogenin-like [Archocentrus centrarchus]|uniref:vitellogenin-like n=1 Tax=Archocentrus centrarchus TaxID=63155 RepID=UPI0011E9D32C|nr:vitellogenin-like [Archocentrus centrarchus]